MFVPGHRTGGRFYPVEMKKNANHGQGRGKALFQAGEAGEHTGAGALRPDMKGCKCLSLKNGNSKHPHLKRKMR